MAGRRIIPIATVEGDSDCTSCGLHVEARSVCMMGEGPVPCDYMAIGEAPGFQEDRVGKPFQGKSGKFLDEFLAEAGLPRGTIYLTNSVKCRPPDNRTPARSEAKACAPWLEKEMEIVKPKFVMLLGAAALKSVMKKGKITQLRGSVIEMDGIKYMPVFHPSAGLHDPGKMPAVRQDIIKFGKLCRGEMEEGEPDITWHVLKKSNYAEFRRQFEEADEFSFDLETSRLEPHFPDSRINCMSISFANGVTWLIPLGIEGSFLYGHYEIQKQLIEALTLEATNSKKKVTGHNGKFDNTWLLVQFGCRFVLSDDSQLMHYILNENSPHQLKFLAKVVLNAPEYDVDDQFKQGKFEHTQSNLMKFYKYCAYDAYYTQQLKTILRADLLREPDLRRLYYKLVMPAARMFEEIEAFGGFTIDRPYRDKISAELQEEEVDLIRGLNELAGKEVNWNSPAQVGRVLFEDWGLDVLEKTPSGAPATGESILLRLRGKHPGLDLLLKHREVSTLVKNYIRGWEELIYNDVLYFSTNLHGTVTGRYSSRLHQTPRNKIIRSQITAPPGWEFFCADYGQIELRIAAILSGDKRMREVFLKGGDIHRNTAANLLGKMAEDLTDEERKRAKAVNFGLIYGMGWKKLMDYARDKYEVILTERESRRWRTGFFELYSDLPDWHDRYRKLVDRQGYVTNLAGRKRRLTGIDSEEEGVRAEAERQAINSPVQGFAGDLKAMGMLEIHHSLPREDIRLLGEVHDSVLGIRRIKSDIGVYQELRKIMQKPKLLEDFNIKLNIPIIVDIERGPWGSKGNPI